jgi:hypothetical protein
MYRRSNATWYCYNQTNGATAQCGTWSHLFYSNPSSGEMAGSLFNSSAQPPSGLLGQIPQQPYTSSYVAATSPANQTLLVPFFDLYSSPDAIDNTISEYLYVIQANAHVLGSVRLTRLVMQKKAKWQRDNR